MKQYLKEVARGKKGSRDLSYEEASGAAQIIIQGEATDAQIAALLVAERLKGESANEVIAFVHQFRKVSEQVDVSAFIRHKLIDVAGPYNGRKTFAATIPVSILLAEHGLPVYMHSSDSLPPKEGISIKDILSELGIPVELTNREIAHSLEENRIGFAWTEKLCPSLARIRHVRKEIGVRSFLNTAEKILNLANSSTIMVGIFHKTVVDLQVAVLRALGFDKAYIVQGAEGSEDLPIHRKSFLYEVTQHSVRDFDIDPEEFGLKQRKDPVKEDLSLEQQVSIIQRILAGDESDDLHYYRSQVIFNAGVRYFLFNQTDSIIEGIRTAEQQLQQKKGAAHLKRWAGGRP